MVIGKKTEAEYDEEVRVKLGKSVANRNLPKIPTDLPPDSVARGAGKGIRGSAHIVLVLRRPTKHEWLHMELRGMPGTKLVIRVIQRDTLMSRDEAVEDFALRRTLSELARSDP